MDAVRKRVKRGTLESERGADGRLYVFIDADEDTDSPRSDTDRLISTLEEQLRLEREAHAEARRIIAGLVERVPPALPPPSEEPLVEEEAETPDPPRWWEFWRG